jgi:hypothetical protein
MYIYMLYYILEIVIIYIYNPYIYIYTHYNSHVQKVELWIPQEVAAPGLTGFASQAVTRLIRLPAPFPRLRDRPWGWKVRFLFPEKNWDLNGI